ncbi:MAG: transglycosylase family protein [Chloroflexota bacterium]
MEAARRARALRRRQRLYAALPAGVAMSTLESIAACESGGSPTAVSADGSYRGKYQFDYGTWASVGGSGDPAAAPEAEQDYRAALLYARSGSSPWPVCG